MGCHINKNDSLLRKSYGGTSANFIFVFFREWLTRFFFISNTFTNNARLRLAKNQVNVKQHPETELLVFENFSHSSSCYYPKIIHILKNKQKNKCVFIHEIIRLIIMKMKMKMKNRSHRYDINRPKPPHGHRYSK